MPPLLKISLYVKQFVYHVFLYLEFNSALMLRISIQIESYKFIIIVRPKVFSVRIYLPFLDCEYFMCLLLSSFGNVRYWFYCMLIIIHP